MDFGFAAGYGADGTAAVASAASGGSASNKKEPQQGLNEFWESMMTKAPGKVYQVFPRSLYENLLPPIKPGGAASSMRATASYDAAVKECKERVKRVVRECHRTNEKFTDPDFDIEDDWYWNCIDGLDTDVSKKENESGSGAFEETMDSFEGARKPKRGKRHPKERANKSGYGRSSAATKAGSKPVKGQRATELRGALKTLVDSKVLSRGAQLPIDIATLHSALSDGYGDSQEDEECADCADYPPSIHRVDWIFDDPKFIIDDFSTTDVRQGSIGDCWWVAAVANICSMPELMRKICVARDAECGVYGFVFYRDGEWVSTIIDDNLYLRYVNNLSRFTTDIE
jgi:hypothetical protein